VSLAVVSSTAPLAVRLKGETANTRVDFVEQGSSGFIVGERVRVAFEDRLVVISRLIRP
jgi:photosystem II stability/assembly factor-like uncharacterized protein